MIFCLIRKHTLHINMMKKVFKRFSQLHFSHSISVLLENHTRQFIAHFISSLCYLQFQMFTFTETSAQKNNLPVSLLQYMFLCKICTSINIKRFNVRFFKSVITQQQKKGEGAALYSSNIQKVRLYISRVLSP